MQAEETRASSAAGSVEVAAVSTTRRREHRVERSTRLHGVGPGPIASEPAAGITIDTATLADIAGQNVDGGLDAAVDIDPLAVARVAAHWRARPKTLGREVIAVGTTGAGDS